MTNAENQREVFWRLFKEELKLRGKPFSIKEKDHFATINRNSAVSDYCLSIDFMYRDQFIRVGIYMLDDIPAFEQMYSHMDEIEDFVGIPLDWITSGTKRSSVRRIKVNIPFVKDDVYSYLDAITKAISYACKMKEIFPKYSNEKLFDF